MEHINDNGDKVEVGLIKTGIAWQTDKDVKFNNPKGFDPANPSAGMLNPQKYKILANLIPHFLMTIFIVVLFIQFC